jgi:hypothetical protein
VKLFWGDMYFQVSLNLHTSKNFKLEEVNMSGTTDDFIQQKLELIKPVLKTLK